MVGLFLLTLLPVAAAIVFVRLLARNAHRLGSVVRITRGHVIAAVVMALVSPLGVIYSIPISLPFVLTDPDLSVSASLLWIVAYGFAWYLPASLVVSGTRNKLLRVLALVLFWMAWFSCMIFVGVISGRTDFTLPGI